MAAFDKKLQEAGLKPAPKAIPDAPDKYEIKPPDNFGDVDTTTIDKVKAWGHKVGLTQEELGEGMGIYFEHHKDIMPVIGELKKLVPALKFVKEDSIRTFEDEMRGNGHDPEKVKATIGRFVAKKYSRDQVLSMGDYGDSPIVMRLLYDNALASHEDFGPIKLEEGPVVYDQEAQTELDQILTPGTDKNKIWASRTPEGAKMIERATELRKKITGNR